MTTPPASINGSTMPAAAPPTTMTRPARPTSICGDVHPNKTFVADRRLNAAVGTLAPSSLPSASTISNLRSNKKKAGVDPAHTGTPPGTSSISSGQDRARRRLRRDRGRRRRVRSGHPGSPDSPETPVRWIERFGPSPPAPPRPPSPPIPSAPSEPSRPATPRPPSPPSPPGAVPADDAPSGDGMAEPSGPGGAETGGSYPSSFDGSAAWAPESGPRRHHPCPCRRPWSRRAFFRPVRRPAPIGRSGRVQLRPAPCRATARPPPRPRGSATPAAAITSCRVSWAAVTGARSGPPGSRPAACPCSGRRPGTARPA